MQYGIECTLKFVCCSLHSLLLRRDDQIRSPQVKMEKCGNTYCPDAHSWWVFWLPGVALCRQPTRHTVHYCICSDTPDVFPHIISESGVFSRWCQPSHSWDGEPLNWGCWILPPHLGCDPVVQCWLALRTWQCHSQLYSHWILGWEVLHLWAHSFPQRTLPGWSK